MQLSVSRSSELARAGLLRGLGTGSEAVRLIGLDALASSCAGALFPVPGVS